MGSIPEIPAVADAVKVDRANTICFVTFADGVIQKREMTDLNEGAIRLEGSGGQEEEASAPAGAKDGLHPMLEEWLQDPSRREDWVEIIITFDDSFRLPRFPELNPSEPRTSDENMAVIARTAEMIGFIQRQRDIQYDEIRKMLEPFSPEYMEDYWIICGMQVSVQIKFLPDIAGLQEILYIEPVEGDEPPPAVTVADGRTLVETDGYYGSGTFGGWVALLDTGVSLSHGLLKDPRTGTSCIDRWSDCVNGGVRCMDNASTDPNDSDDHGTATAAILSGNLSMLDDYRGVSSSLIDSFKVYSPTSAGGASSPALLDHRAAIRGFQQAVAARNFVIVAEMQAKGPDVCAISRAADHAFDTGSLVVAANGNLGSVRSPANAHRVIGVGCYDAVTLGPAMYQSNGPAPDNRVKPDVQAPTNTTTASISSASSLREFGGTSGATPYVAGAAALLRTWMLGSDSSIDPGHIYARLILCGQQPFPFDNVVGAGRLLLPREGHSWWGKAVVPASSHSSVHVINIPLSEVPGNGTLDAALWWPELASSPHSTVHLRLLDPAGGEAHSSTCAPSVFQRARTSGNLDVGVWTLQIRGQIVPVREQEVYWTACFQPA